MKILSKGLASLAAGVGVAVSAATPAFAHEATGGGFGGGFVHPFGGVDHLLVMLSVGALAALRGSRADLAIPGAFLGAMVAGGLAALAGAAVPGVEPMILASLLAVGCLAGAGVQMSSRASAAVVAVFAFFHGLAHGGEIPAGAEAAAYVTGFTTAAALLLACGWAAAATLRGVRRLQRG